MLAYFMILINLYALDDENSHSGGKLLVAGVPTLCYTGKVLCSHDVIIISIG